MASSFEQRRIKARRAKLGHVAESRREAGSEVLSLASMRERARGQLPVLQRSIDELRRVADASFRFLQHLDEQNEHIGLAEDYRRSGATFGFIERAGRLDLPPSEIYEGLPDEEVERFQTWRIKSEKRKRAESKRYVELDRAHPWGWHIIINNPFLKTGAKLRIPRSFDGEPTVVRLDPKPIKEDETSLDKFIGKLPEVDASKVGRDEYEGPFKVKERPDETFSYSTDIIVAHLVDVEVILPHLNRES